MPPKRKPEAAPVQGNDSHGSSLEAVILDYLNRLDTLAAPLAKDLVIAVKAKLPTARNKHIVLEWNRIRSQYITSDQDSTLKNAFMKEPILSLAMVQSWLEEEIHASSEHGQEASEFSHISDTPAAHPNPTVQSNRPMQAKRTRTADVAPVLPTSTPRSLTSPSSQPGSSSRSSASSTSTLRVEAIKRMDEQFIQNYEEFEGVEWTLPSGTIVDRTVRDYVQTLRKESTLHSFVISQTRSLIQCFSPEDRSAFQKSVSESDKLADEDLPLSEWKKAKIRQYQVAPKEIWTILQSGWTTTDITPEVDEPKALLFCCSLHQAMLDLASVYRNYRYRLPPNKPEAWYRTKIWGFLWKIIDANGILEIDLGEVTSSASSLRKNGERVLETKQFQGRKIDGIVTCCVTNLEICAMEAGKTDQGSNGTKVLQDSVKMAKVLKDMFDAVCSQCSAQPESIRPDLRVYGILVSGLRMDFVSFRYLEGRFFRMQTEDTIHLPSAWDDDGIATGTIIASVSKIISFTERMERMSAKITKWTQVSADTKATDNRSPMVATLTTPYNSPRR